MADESIAGVAEATDVPAGADVQAMVSGEGNPPAVDGKEEAEKQEAKDYDNPELVCRFCVRAHTYDSAGAVPCV